MTQHDTIWAPYTPDDKMPWDLPRVAHLHRRAGFAATWSEIQRDLKDGPEASIDRLLSGMVPVAVGIALVIFCALALLRSLVAPLYLLAASALSAAAPLGLTAYLFQGRLGQASLAYYAPLGAGVLLIALGSDYNLLVVGRVWEESRARPCARPSS